MERGWRGGRPGEKLAAANDRVRKVYGEALKELLGTEKVEQMRLEQNKEQKQQSKLKRKEPERLKQEPEQLEQDEDHLYGYELKNQRIKLNMVDGTFSAKIASFSRSRGHTVVLDPVPGE